MQSDASEVIVGQLLQKRDGLFAYILSMVKDWNTAEDIFQDVTVTVLKKAGSDVEVQYFGAWFREIARRSILDYWKKEKRNQNFFNSRTLDIIDCIYAKHENDDLRASIEHLRICLNLLPARFRQLIDLRYQGGLSMDQIGDLVKKSAGHVQVTLSRIRMRLLDCMKKEAAQ